ncbi:MAG: class I SAM-dependent methyltransferase [Syntrophobacteraceae bacterium]
MVVKSEHDPTKWERQFREGGWDFLKSENQIARYSVLSSYMKHLGRPIALLDVGCGEGLILNFCDRKWLAHYSGVDISQTGLDRIKSLLPTDRLICSGLEEFTSQEKFDVILFNEVLYYTADPESHLKRFRNYLNPGGFILISSWKHAGLFSRNSRSVRAVWNLIGKCEWKKIDEVIIKNIPHKAIWRIAIMQP